MHLSSFLHFIAPSVIFPSSFNECCFALCSTFRLQFGIWESWLDSKTVVTQCLLLIKPCRRAEWALAEWVPGGSCSAWRVNVVVVYVDVLVLKQNCEKKKWSLKKKVSRSSVYTIVLLSANDLCLFMLQL